MIALWSLCLLTIFAVNLGYGIRQKVVLIQRLNSRANLHFIAEAGVKQAIAELKKEDTTEYDALNQAWSNNPAMFRQDIGYGTFSVGYNYMDSQSGLEGIRYGLVDEESLEDIKRKLENPIRSTSTVCVTVVKKKGELYLKRIYCDRRD